MALADVDTNPAPAVAASTAITNNLGIPYLKLKPLRMSPMIGMRCDRRMVVPVTNGAKRATDGPDDPTSGRIGQS
jgi:hypothetical protein